MCDECGVPYNTKSTLRQHKMAVHPLTNNGQTYPCLHSGNLLRGIDNFSGMWYKGHGVLWTTALPTSDFDS